MTKNGNTEKSIEARFAAIEAKLAKIFITDDEMKAYLKVSALLGCDTPDGKSATRAGSTCQCATAQTVARAVNRDVINRVTHGDCECTCGQCCTHSSNNVMARASWGSSSGSGI